MVIWHNYFSWRCCVFPIKFSYWSKFHVNVITGSTVITIFVDKGLTRNPEIENTPIWVLPNIWKMGQVRGTVLVEMSLIKCYWMIKNASVTAFTVFELLRERVRSAHNIIPILWIKFEEDLILCFPALTCKAGTWSPIWYHHFKTT